VDDLEWRVLAPAPCDTGGNAWTSSFGYDPPRRHVFSTSLPETVARDLPRGSGLGPRATARITVDEAAVDHLLLVEQCIEALDAEGGGRSVWVG
jgi:hypothetical protein